jgi:hypothetical protein
MLIAYMHNRLEMLDQNFDAPLFNGMLNTFRNSHIEVRISTLPSSPIWRIVIIGRYHIAFITRFYDNQS